MDDIKREWRRRRKLNIHRREKRVSYRLCVTNDKATEEIERVEEGTENRIRSCTDGGNDNRKGKKR